MNKQIMISIRPEHAVNILNGKKTLELRKNVPKDFTGWVYIYFTKGKPYIEPRIDAITKQKVWNIHNDLIYHTDLNGKVVARFWFDEYEKLEWFDASLGGKNLKRDYNYWYLEGNGKYVSVEWLLIYLYLTKQQVLDYGKGKDLYAWHIKRLEIFDKPMELSDFYNFKTKINLTRPPQSWQYMWVKEVNNE